MLQDVSANREPSTASSASWRSAAAGQTNRVVHQCGDARTGLSRVASGGSAPEGRGPYRSTAFQPSAATTKSDWPSISVPAVWLPIQYLVQAGGIEVLKAQNDPFALSLDAQDRPERPTPFAFTASATPSPQASPSVGLRPHM